MAAKSDIFEYTHDGKKIKLPLLSKLKFGIVRKLRKLEDTEQMFAMVEMVADEDALGVIDDMTQDEAVEFFNAWSEASGIEPGESDE